MTNIEYALEEIKILEAENMQIRTQLAHYRVMKNQLRQEFIQTGGIALRANAHARKSLDNRIAKLGRKHRKNNERMDVLCRKYNIVR